MPCIDYGPNETNTCECGSSKWGESEDKKQGMV